MSSNKSLESEYRDMIASQAAGLDADSLWVRIESGIDNASDVSDATERVVNRSRTRLFIKYGAAVLIALFISSPLIVRIISNNKGNGAVYESADNAFDMAESNEQKNSLYGEPQEESESAPVIAAPQADNADMASGDVYTKTVRIEMSMQMETGDSEDVMYDRIYIANEIDTDEPIVFFSLDSKVKMKSGKKYTVTIREMEKPSTGEIILLVIEAE